MTSKRPAPGVYQNVPFEEYLAWPAVSNSALTWLARSPAHFRHAQVGGLIVEETPAMRLGTLCHAGQFEPLRIIERYAVMPRFEDQIRRPDGGEYNNPRATSAYRAEVAEWTGKHAEKIVVNQDEYDRMTNVVRAIDANQRAHHFLDGKGLTEVSLVWVDPETGIHCKARLDFLSEEYDRIVDLKTTVDASDWARVMLKREYHRQFAFYRAGVKHLLGSLAWCINIVAETSAPWCVRSAPLSSELLTAGTDRYRYLLHLLKSCTEADRWPGYEDPQEWAA